MTCKNCNYRHRSECLEKEDTRCICGDSTELEMREVGKIAQVDNQFGMALQAKDLNLYQCPNCKTVELQ